MKRIFLVSGVFVFSIFMSKAQDLKVGLRITPLNSNYFMDDMMNLNQTNSYHDKYETRFDSLTIGLFSEKYFSKKSFLLKVDFSYSNLNISSSDNETSSDTLSSNTYVTNSKQVENQKYYNLNLGIGNNISISKLVLSFGLYVPITILPKGSISRNISNSSNGILESSTECTGKYKGTFIYGIGTFVGINTIIFKHLSIGADFTYQIQHLTRKLDWHGETHYYGMNPSSNIDDETITFRNYFTSKLVPSILIAYTFNWKKESQPLVNR